MDVRTVKFGNKEISFLSLRSLDDMSDDFAKEVVLDSGKITIQVSYPLSVEYEFVMESANGFSREELYRGIVDAYQEVYKDVNDQNTYGVWGHGIGDLVLVSMTEIKKNVFEIGVCS